MFKKSIIFVTTVIALTILTSSGCKYSKLRKIKDVDVKYKAANEYYENEKYAKALGLYDDIVLLTRGTKKGEDVLFKLANTNYHLRDYILAGYYFRKYVETYPKGKFAEDAQYMSAYCYFLDAPKSKLEQTATYTALQEFELFITKYPKSPKIKECNEIVDKLRAKLEKKSYENAILYYDIGYYRAATVALTNSVEDFPDSNYREDILFYIVKSHYLYANNSIYNKQKERYSEVLKAYKKLISKFPETKYKKEADNILSNTKKKLTKYKN